jgi:LuxR family transcriptional regulator, maltose regulon positive regulatory protein
MPRTVDDRGALVASCCAAEARIADYNGDMAGADTLVSRAVEVVGRSGTPPLVSLALLQRAKMLGQRGDRVGSAASLAEAEEQLRGCPDPGVHRHTVESIRRLLRGGTDQAASNDLTERELAVLRLLVTSLTQREIGSELYVSLNTVKTHVNSIRRKLCASTRAEAVSRGRELGLI